MFSELLRFLIVALLLLVLGFDSPVVAVTALLVGAVTLNWLLIRENSNEELFSITAGESEDLKSRQIIIEQTRLVIPGALHSVVQGPLLIALAGYAGGQLSVAEVGALGRISILFGILTGFVSGVVVPKFVAITDETRFRQRYLLALSLMIALSGFLFMLALMFATEILLILGDNYRNLEAELVIASVTSLFGTITAFGYGINRLRGWTQYQVPSVIMLVFVQVLLLLSLELIGTREVLLFGMFSMMVGMSLQIVLNWRGLYKAGGNS
ncbi:MAG: hypothetical protein ISP91_04540 [Pseudomonadales bacterium]|nr:hypothetical protein [Pseudomonadales bacterium]